MGKLMVELPNNMHGELKKKAAAQHLTLKTIVTDLIEDYLSAPAKEQARGKKTGLCGSWDDERSAEEIIRDVRGRSFDRKYRAYSRCDSRIEQD